MKQLKMSGWWLVLAVVVCAVFAGATSFTDVNNAKYWGKTGLPVLTETLDANFALLESGYSNVLQTGYILVGDATSNAAAVAVSGDVTITTAGAVAIGANKVLESMLKAVDTAADEDFLSYESTTGDFEWHSAAEIAGKFATVGTLSTNVIVDASYTNTIVLRTLASGVLVVSSWTQNAVAP